MGKGKHKVLLIDDSIFMRRKIESILSIGGYSIAEASTGREGLEAAEKEDFDCIVLDLLMPDMDGFKVLEKLRAIRNTVPIIIASSDIQDSAKGRCFKLGAFDFVEKPPDKEILLHKVHIAIGLNEEGGTLVLSDKQNDVLKEMINIGIGKGAEMLNVILATHIKLEVPFVRVLSQSEFEFDVKKNQLDSLAAVNLSFKGDISGNVELVFPKESAANLVAALIGEEPNSMSLDSIRTGTLSEVGNIVINAVIGSISNMLNFKLAYSTPTYVEGDYEKLSMMIRKGANSVILQARARFIIDMFAVTGDIVLFLELDSLDKIFTIIERVSNDQ
ncbi:response regulator [Chitinispirillales bacterium ANBcel5]|uniref:response regulator n=1 Tax=Cellulosispirillum alkaliphilum TaxID=3039283 RepID=UPI002A57FF0C|nr:response regulator [Chitinispirillales bacterium ANBcel5]